ncbi:SDR family oxidoreductase [Chitinimonas arctica]|uniref:SDR family oxidoreductase n=1 Tax=Chitinimonas arctica TaxID=2594795 RepID=A0A516SG46_9NEIS|nr:SDR family oxidoreductase [Chitinimonas arctica]QDQ26998.1 SDR family oxidoreductase [Chitinimonas arctica]
MRILLIGSSGFIGTALRQALQAAGHLVVGSCRDPLRASATDIAADFAQDQRPQSWLPRVAGFDAVINGVGILREQGDASFEAIHVRGPCALFAACAEAGVGRVIQISALGADAQAASPYHLSKRQADDYLLSLPISACVLQPSLVYGPGGTSTQMFKAWAALPLIPLPGQGEQLLQPVHIDDLCAAVVALLAQPTMPPRLAVVGPLTLTLRAYLQTLRQAMGLGAGCFLPVPMALMRPVAWLSEQLPAALLDRDTLAMLERGNHADGQAMQDLLQRPLQAPAAFIPSGEAQSQGRQARLALAIPLLRLSIAFVWLYTAWVSIFAYPIADSLALLAAVGLTGTLGTISLYGSALLDLSFGLGTLLLRRRKSLYLAQLALIAFYTIVITVCLPHFWWHPYGPLLKNLPMLAALWLLYVVED